MCPLLDCGGLVELELRRARRTNDLVLQAFVSNRVERRLRVLDVSHTQVTQSGYNEKVARPWWHRDHIPFVRRVLDLLGYDAEQESELAGLEGSRLQALVPPASDGERAYALEGIDVSGCVVSFATVAALVQRCPALRFVGLTQTGIAFRTLARVRR